MNSDSHSVTDGDTDDPIVLDEWFSRTEKKTYQSGATYPLRVSSICEISSLPL